MKDKLIKIAGELIKIAEELISINTKKDRLTKFSADLRVIVRPNELKAYKEDGFVCEIKKVDENTFEVRDRWRIYFPIDIIWAFELSQEYGIDRSYFEEAFGKLPDIKEVSLKEFVDWFYTFFDLRYAVFNRLDTFTETIIDKFGDLVIKQRLPFDEELVKEVAEEGLEEYFRPFFISEDFRSDYRLKDEIAFFEIIEPLVKERIEFDASRNVVIIGDLTEFLTFVGEMAGQIYEDLNIIMEEFLEKQTESIMNDLLNRYEEALESE